VILLGGGHFTYFLSRGGGKLGCRDEIWGFTNMFTQSFYARRSQERKMVNDLTVIFALLGSKHVKAVRKMLMNGHLNGGFFEYFRRIFCITDDEIKGKDKT